MLALFIIRSITEWLFKIGQSLGIRVNYNPISPMSQERVQPPFIVFRISHKHRFRQPDYRVGGILLKTTQLVFFISHPPQASKPYQSNEQYRWSFQHQPR